MAYFEWSSAYETGVAGIDYDHRRLVAMLNDIHGLITGGAEPGKIGDVLVDFQTLATAHFALEERIMEDESHAGIAERRRIHHRLLDQVCEIIDAYEADDPRPDQSLPATLRGWLMEAMSMDVQLFTDINDTGPRHWDLRRG